jgi:hypothetical protein
MSFASTSAMEDASRRNQSLGSSPCIPWRHEVDENKEHPCHFNPQTQPLWTT